MGVSPMRASAATEPRSCAASHDSSDGLRRSRSRGGGEGVGVGLGEGLLATPDARP